MKICILLQLQHYSLGSLCYSRSSVPTRLLLSTTKTHFYIIIKIIHTKNISDNSGIILYFFILNTRFDNILRIKRSNEVLSLDFPRSTTLMISGLLNPLLIEPSVTLNYLAKSSDTLV